MKIKLNREELGLLLYALGNFNLEVKDHLKLSEKEYLQVYGLYSKLHDQRNKLIDNDKY